MPSEAAHYIGDELHLFQHAQRWKAYWGAHVRPLIQGDVLEVGAGIGANTDALWTSRVTSWHGLEPDAVLARQARAATAARPTCRVTEETTAALPVGSYDTVLYIDVLEHIEHDHEEVARAAALLRPGGHLIVLGPAHQSLFSPFDAAIGHFRRYDKASLRACGVPGLHLASLAYLDSLGALVSFANRLLLRQAQPTLSQILFWDRCVVPVSRVLDPLLGHRLGKSILAVWRKV